jgi:uncharacterized membrane-anchored protein YjiN (DUF445 family)
MKLLDSLGFTSRETYLKTSRLLTQTEDRLADEQQSNRLLRDTVRSQKEMIAALSRDDVQAVIQRHDALLAEITQVRVALGRAVTLQGLTETSPVATLVDLMVRDHDELESRIEAALVLLASHRDSIMPDDVARILRGAPRVPDTIEGAF